MGGQKNYLSRLTNKHNTISANEKLISELIRPAKQYQFLHTRFLTITMHTFIALFFIKSFFYTTDFLRSMKNFNMQTLWISIEMIENKFFGFYTYILCILSKNNTNEKCIGNFIMKKKNVSLLQTFYTFLSSAGRYIFFIKTCTFFRGSLFVSRICKTNLAKSQPFFV